MYKITFTFIVALLFTSSFAEVVSVAGPIESYRLTYSNDLVKIESSTYKMEVKANACIQDSLSFFVSSVDKLVRNGGLKKSESRESLIVYYKEKKYFATKGSALADGLLLLPQEVRRLHVEKQLNCRQ